MRQLAGGVRNMLIHGAKHQGDHGVVAHNRGQFKHSLLAEDFDHLPVQRRADRVFMKQGSPEANDKRIFFGQSIERTIVADGVDGFRVDVGAPGAGFVRRPLVVFVKFTGSGSV